MKKMVFIITAIPASCQVPDAKQKRPGIPAASVLDLLFPQRSMNLFV